MIRQLPEENRWVAGHFCWALTNVAAMSEGLEFDLTSTAWELFVRHMPAHGTARTLPGRAKRRVRPATDRWTAVSMRRKGKTVTQICDALQSVSRATVYRWLKATAPNAAPPAPRAAGRRPLDARTHLASVMQLEQRLKTKPALTSPGATHWTTDMLVPVVAKLFKRTYTVLSLEKRLRQWGFVRVGVSRDAGGTRLPAHWKGRR